MKQFIERLILILQGAIRSWTIWVNAVAGALLAALPDLQMAFPQIQGYIPEIYYKYAMGFLIAANLLLRVKTKQSLTEIAKK